MIKISRYGRLLSHFHYLMIGIFLTACATKEVPTNTLADWDKDTVEVISPSTRDAASQQKSNRVAYEDFIKNEDVDEKLRLAAISRLSKMEMNRFKALTDSQSEDSVLLEEQQVNALNRSIQLLELALSNNPSAKDADYLLYQLAQFYERLGKSDVSLEKLRLLAQQFPASSFNAEAQFRLGEEAFLQEDYFSAEIAYTEVSLSGAAHPLYEKAMVKRGWSRIKQGYYTDAIEDFTKAINARQFGHYKKIKPSDQNDFEEYFRALTIAASQGDGFHLLHDQLENANHTFYVYVLSSRVAIRSKDYLAASKIMENFISQSSSDLNIAEARLHQLTIYRLANQQQEYAKLLEQVYQQYGPHSSFGKKHLKSADYTVMTESLRNHMLILADREQVQFRRTKSSASFQLAKYWYDRYLEHFTSSAKKDKVYSAYAELLVANKDYLVALALFDKAAFDGDIVLDKESAYAAIDISNNLLKTSQDKNLWFEKLVSYFNKTQALYATEERYKKLSIYLLEQAYDLQKYDVVLSLRENLSAHLSTQDRNRADYLKALALLKISQPGQAEAVLAQLIKTSPKNLMSDYRNALALAIYDQAQAAVRDKNYLVAINHAIRAASLLPEAPTAAEGLYEAIVLSIDNQYWPEAATTIELFQKQYPKHQAYQDVGRQLSQVYINLGNNEKAAYAFESLSAQNADQDVKMAALWQAAELYFSQKKYVDALRNYEAYVKSFPLPYAQNIEALTKIIELKEINRDVRSANEWRKKLVDRDKSIGINHKNTRTNTLAAKASLHLANLAKTEFDRIKLVEPLAQNLSRKKQFMQQALASYGQAASYQLEEATLEATYKIGSIYQEFSQSLLNSERPKNLSADDLEEYNMLLEDQAFPFEEKAIEFYEINTARIANNASGEWIVKSLEDLKLLFPSRYSRKFKWTAYQASGKP